MKFMLFLLCIIAVKSQPLGTVIPYNRLSGPSSSTVLPYNSPVSLPLGLSIPYGPTIPYNRPLGFAGLPMTRATCPANSIPNKENTVCCPKGCSVCGGKMCGQRKLGGENCCGSVIMKANKRCGTAPCVLNGGVMAQPIPRPTPRPAPAPVLPTPAPYVAPVVTAPIIPAPVSPVVPYTPTTTLPYIARPPLVTSPYTTLPSAITVPAAPTTTYSFNNFNFGATAFPVNWNNVLPAPTTTTTTTAPLYPTTAPLYPTTVSRPVAPSFPQFSSYPSFTSLPAPQVPTTPVFAPVAPAPAIAPAVAPAAPVFNPPAVGVQPGPFRGDVPAVIRNALNTRLG